MHTLPPRIGLSSLYFFFLRFILSSFGFSFLVTYFQPYKMMGSGCSPHTYHFFLHLFCPACLDMVLTYVYLLWFLSPFIPPPRLLG